MADEERRIGLLEAVDALRDELQEAIDRPTDGLRFGVDEIEVEFQVATEWEASAKAGIGGKIKYWLLSADAEAEASGRYGKTKSHSIKLKLSLPDDQDKRSRTISDDEPL